MTMFNLVATRSAKVGFAAKSMYVDRSNVLWARLMNGMLARYDLIENETEVSSFRINGIAWSKSKAYFVDDSLHFTTIDLATKEMTVGSRIRGGTGPICFNSSEKLLICCAEEVYEVSASGSLSLLFNVDYEIMSIAAIRNEIWVGGYGLDRYDIATGEMRCIENERKFPVLQIAVNSDSTLIAAAGGDIRFYRDGKLVTHFGNSLFRCQFSQSNILFTKTQENCTMLTPEWHHFRVAGVDVCAFSDCACIFCYGEIGSEKVVVSCDGSLFFYECVIS